MMRMKRNFFIAATAALVMASCGNTQKADNNEWIDNALDIMNG